MRRSTGLCCYTPPLLSNFHLCLFLVSIQFLLCSSSRGGDLKTREQIDNSSSLGVGRPDRQTKGMEHSNLTSTPSDQSSEPKFGVPIQVKSYLTSSPFFAISVERDPKLSSSRINVALPSGPGEFTAKAVDVSPTMDSSLKDINRTVFTTASNRSIINIDDLYPGHHYRVSVYHRLGTGSFLVKQETVVMLPIAPIFNSSNSSILIAEKNITLRAVKPSKALQDKYRLVYEQLDPPRRYQPLDIRDIIDQHDVEIYIGNLSPGRTYNVSVTPMINNMSGEPWRGTLTTEPLPPYDLVLSTQNDSCIQAAWKYPNESGVDGFVLLVRQKGTSQSKITEWDIRPTDRTWMLCHGIRPGAKYTASLRARKLEQNSKAIEVQFVAKPMPPDDLRVTADYQAKRFKLEVSIASSKQAVIDQCEIFVVNDKLRVQKRVNVKIGDHDASERMCWLYIDFHPGERYEIAAQTLSDQTPSNKVYSNFVMKPAFDMNEFGLTLQEADNGISLLWSTDVLVRARVASIWSNLVGNKSSLVFRVESLEKNISRRIFQNFSTDPDEDFSLSISPLSKGACYKIQIYTITNSGIVSARQFADFVTLEPPEANITVEEIAATSASVRVSRSIQNAEYPPDCKLSLGVIDMSNMAVFDRTFDAQSLPNSFRFQDLLPFHRYRVRAKVVCSNTFEKRCRQRARELYGVVFETQQDRPGPVRSLAVEALNPFSVRLTWLPPALANGVITHYVVRIIPQDIVDHKRIVNIDVPFTQNEEKEIAAVIDEFIGGLKYRFDVRAVTEAGEGDLNVTSGAVGVQMPLLPPPRVPTKLEIVPHSVTYHGFTVRFSTTLFNTENGLLTKRAIIVAEVDRNGHISNRWISDRRNKTRTWQEVQQFDIWPPYFAVETLMAPVRKFSPPTELSEAIGTDEHCADINTDVICNGPLRPGTEYRVSLRLYTAENLWTDFDSADSVITANRQSATNITALLVLFFIIISTGTVFLITAVLWRKRRKSCLPVVYTGNHCSKESQWAALKMMMTERATDCLAKLGLDSQHMATSSDAESVADVTANCLSASCGHHHHHRSRSLRERTGVDQRLERLPSGPAPCQKSMLYTVLSGTNINKSRPVRVCDFPDHVRLMSADSDFRFSEEYDDLKLVGHGQPCIAADLTENRAKNRFTNILPFDHSRVKLRCTDEEDGSDYINASYIPGFNSRREFIAAQGPLPSTRDHFWRLVWEQQCPAIVALTKCVEKGRDKCHQYWPDSDQLSVLYADIEVTLISETVFDEFIVRELRLTNVAESSTPPRTVRHLHYMAWPDFGVPDSPFGIVRFVRLFRHKLPPSVNNRPTIVHCSAGVGRSGTFIALDRLIQAMHRDIPLDVFGVVCDMRMERCHMVQNEQQYIFIHQCLLYVLQEESSNALQETIVPSVDPLSPATNVIARGVTPNTTNLAQQKSFQNPSVVAFNNFMVKGPTIEHQVAPPWMNSSSRIEVHQNPAFDDTEGIAESGL